MGSQRRPLETDEGSGLGLFTVKEEEFLLHCKKEGKAGERSICVSAPLFGPLCLSVQVCCSDVPDEGLVAPVVLTL